MKRIFTLAILIATMSSCCRTNPFLTEWNTPYGIPPFDQIRESDYIPALKAGLDEKYAQIEAIANNPEAPTFDNTIAALEYSGAILNKLRGVLENVVETDQTDGLIAIVEESIPLISKLKDDINFNKAIFERVKAVYNADQSGLTREQQVVLKKYYDKYVQNGIDLSSEDQDKLRNINIELAAKTQIIGNNILAESNAFKQKFGFSIASYPEMMTSTEDRELRRQYNEAYNMRGHNGNDNDNSQLILDVMKLRIEKAKLLGFDNPAQMILAPKMAANPATVDAFLEGIMKSAVAKAKEEIADMQEMMDRDIAAGLLPAGSKIEAWDWWYYAEKVRKEKYDLDEDEVRKYFQKDNVVAGVFAAAKRLYGVNAEKIEGVPAYNKDCVTTYKLTYDDGSLIGIFTTDLLPRDSKRGGAWMNNVREQIIDAQGNMIRPIIVNVGNLSEYMSISDVATMFHEFGHALHGLLSQCTYRSISGTNVSRDFVEMFSQFNENWAFQPELLAIYAKNDAGEVIPAELVAKINNAEKFNQGFMTTELCAASILDMKWHELESVEGIDIAGFEAKVCEQMGLIPEIAPRYRTTYFNHIFSSGYEAGYYGYLWAEVLDKDAFSIFEASKNGVWDLELSRKFKETFLEKGGSEEPMTLYKSFVGREPDNHAMLSKRGLI